MDVQGATLSYQREADELKERIERRDKLRAFITASSRLPEDVKTRILTQLESDRVPASMVARIESRMGG